MCKDIKIVFTINISPPHGSLTAGISQAGVYLNPSPSNNWYAVFKGDYYIGKKLWKETGFFLVNHGEKVPTRKKLRKLCCDLFAKGTMMKRLVDKIDKKQKKEKL